MLNAPVVLPPKRSASLRVITVLDGRRAVQVDAASLPLDPSIPDECPVGPCPHYRCRYHLWHVDPVDREGNPGGRGGNGRQKLGEAVRMASSETCALDVTRRGPQSTKEIARMLGVGSSRWVQIIIKRALAKLEAASDELG